MPKVAEIIREHVTLDVKCVDRLSLNGYIPRLQSEGGVVAFLRQAGARAVPSPAIFGTITDAFKARLRASGPRCGSMPHRIQHRECQIGFHRKTAILLMGGNRPHPARVWQNA
jgi:hypothetical protein